ncbi:sialate O-acetylesterase [Mucilaginibacter sp. AK015]|uniref:sialate O-acetylesterase n=1 Tax=Mucilaginibacter sp. AK015 TaxID=2723072 RepID=UPI00161FBE26|nr:sialate O-acetylesterase [Mucilaginibacter sp. AK015]
MKTRLLLCLLCAVIITGCKKDKPFLPDVDPPVETPVNKPFAVANVLQSNMVIQRDKPARIWGYGKASGVVTVIASWSNGPLTATINSHGEWEVNLAAAPANAIAQTVSVSTPGETTITLTDILIGDVWVCAGQSNMVMPVGPLPPSFGGVENYEVEIADANYPQIRSLTVKEDYQSAPIDQFTNPSGWTICAPATVGGLSATAYFFARKLHTELNVPIGIIVSAVNGSWCETWANNAALQGPLSSYTGQHQSSMLFNGMIAPLSKLSVKGFTWYQGENNQKMIPVTDYTKLNIALINGWRSVFAQGELPFYYVQITPFDDDARGDETENYLAKFRETQMKVREGIGGTGMAITIDAGEKDNHHPRYKKQVGDRLALLALNRTYLKNVQCIGPQYASFSQSGNTITINFVNSTATGLTTMGNKPLKQYFFVAGADRVFRLALASISGDKIMLIVPNGTPSPVVAVRYAFTNYPLTNLQNNAGLPMEPFRTDNWTN